VAAAVAVAAGGKHCTATSAVFMEHYTINRVITDSTYQLYVIMIQGISYDSEQSNSMQ
jgi:hypothetical protein